MTLALRAFLVRHRRRLARVVAVASVLVIALELMPEVPRKVEVELELGPQHRDVLELRVGYFHEGEELHGVQFSFPEGAPDSVHHSLHLPEGEFEVRAQLRGRAGRAATSVRALRTPTQGTVHIRLAN